MNNVQHIIDYVRKGMDDLDNHSLEAAIELASGMPGNRQDINAAINALQRMGEIEPELLVDGHHGVFVPMVFAQRFGDSGFHFPDKDVVWGDEMEILLKGPEHTDYWDVWQYVLDNAVFEDWGCLMQGESGDLFLININQEESNDD